MSILDLPEEKRTCLITGCSSGIGLYSAKALQQKGIRVIATARKPTDVESLKESGLEALQLDMADSQSIEAAVAEVLERTGGQLYALFNNAGFGQPGAVEDLTRDLLRAQFETNVFGVLELCNKILPIMRQQQCGRIIQHSSLLGFISMPFRGAYNASKHALNGMTDTLRMELHYEPIDIITLDTGPIVSKFRDNAYEMFKKNIDKTNSPYQKAYQNMESRLANRTKEAPFTLGPEAVFEKLWHALSAKKPKARYAITKPTYFLALAKRLLSTKYLDKVLIHASGNEGK